MKQLNLIQGTPQWHAHRATHLNASDAPVVMGASSYRKLADWVKERATGVAPEVNEFTQRLFDDGHKSEAAARTLAEQIVGEELFPVTGSNGVYSASFDGLTMLEDVAWEHKRLNKKIIAALDAAGPNATGADLPLEYQIQMEQQIHVSGCGKVLFLATEWNEDYTVCLDQRHVWYFPNNTLWLQIQAAWDHALTLVDSYAPEAEVVKAEGVAPQTLPALRIELTGQVTASNLGEYKKVATETISKINTDLKDDQDFADAETAVKWCGDVEDRIAAAKQHALSQTATIDELFRALDEISETARSKRLALEKLVKTRKEALRIEVVSQAQNELRDFAEKLKTDLGIEFFPVVVDFGTPIKGKKTLASVKEAVAQTLTQAKAQATETANKVKANTEAFNKLTEGNRTLFPDFQGLVQQDQATMLAIVENRLQKHENEQKAKAELEAKAKEDVAKVTAPAPVVEQPAAKIESEKLMKLSEITARIGLPITAAILADLGFEPAATDKAAKLYREDQYNAICQALIAQIKHSMITA